MNNIVVYCFSFKIQLWLKDKKKLTEASKRQGSDLRRHRLMSTNTRHSGQNKPKYPDMEKDLKVWVLEQREQHK